MRNNVLMIFLIILEACSIERNQDLTQFVNPFIGTGGHGHTFPGAVVPNGMVQLSPDTRTKGWDACAGYHYSDSTIIGFSHTHLSGTGIGDYGDILFMPMVDSDLINRGEENIPRSGYRSSFSHNNESASPGYYSVILDDYDIKVELSATTRAGFHRYTFPASGDASILVDLSHSLQNQQNTLLEIEVLNEFELRGFKKTKGWAKDHPVYFHAKFSKPFDAKLFINDEPTDDIKAEGRDIKALLKFDTKEKEQVLVKVALSAVDYQGAKNNLEAEIPHWDFDKIRKDAKKAWNSQLSKIKIETKDLEKKRIFYSGLYHAMISPSIYMDSDGRYVGQNRQIMQSNGENYYTVYSLWDTYRGLNPLLTIINPTLNNEFAANLLQKYREGGCLPMWDLASNYTGTMIGYHAVSVIAEAYLKGARNFNAEEALEACIHSSEFNDVKILYDKDNMILQKLMPVAKLYKDSLGFIPGDKDIESVAKGLEYAYNDWCIAQFAKSLGKMEEYELFTKKSRNYRNYFDASTGFMRGKMSDGTWREPFNPQASNHRKDDYCEGNAWQWSWYVPHNVPDLVSMYGGIDSFSVKLDSLFSMTSEIVGERVSGDISGLIGQYAHGNEPSHHIPHLYNYIGESYKTQELVDRILTTLYFDAPDGLSGNEDCGQMSAWYILNSMGFYPVSPASCEYSWGRPLFDEVKIALEDNKQIHLVIKNNSPENKYIQSMKVNGIENNNPFISHVLLMSGPEIEIIMGNKPNMLFNTIKQNG